MERIYGLVPSHHSDQTVPEVTFDSLADATTAHFADPGTLILQLVGQDWLELHTGLPADEYRASRDRGHDQ